MALPRVTLPTGQTTAADDRDYRGQPAALAPRSVPSRRDLWRDDKGDVPIRSFCHRAPCLPTSLMGRWRPILHPHVMPAADGRCPPDPRYRTPRTQIRQIWARCSDPDRHLWDAVVHSQRNAVSGLIAGRRRTRRDGMSGLGAGASVAAVRVPDLETLRQEQVAYYRARAPEYDLIRAIDRIRTQLHHRHPPCRYGQPSPRTLTRLRAILARGQSIRERRGVSCDQTRGDWRHGTTQVRRAAAAPPE
jgi:hypothetical protein